MKKIFIILLSTLMFANLNYVFCDSNGEAPPEESSIWKDVWGFFSSKEQEQNRSERFAERKKEQEERKVQQEKIKTEREERRLEKEKERAEREAACRIGQEKREKEREANRLLREQKDREREERRLQRDKERAEKERKRAQREEARRIEQKKRDKEQEERKLQQEKIKAEKEAARKVEQERKEREKEEKRLKKEKERAEKEAARRIEEERKEQEKEKRKAERRAKKTKEKKEKVRSAQLTAMRKSKEDRKFEILQQEKEHLELRVNREAEKAKRLADQIQQRREAEAKTLEQALAMREGLEEEESKGYDFAVTDISSKKKDSFKVDVNITSSVPIDVSLKDDRLVIEQVPESKFRRKGKRIGKQKVVAVDMTGIGKTERGGIYKVPTWPFESTFLEEKDLLNVDAYYKHASSAFSSAGHNQDISKLAFGETTMYIRDILLASKLVENSKVTDVTYLAHSNPGSLTTVALKDAQNYLSTVAAQRISFDADFDEIKTSFGYIRRFKNKNISLGIQVPVVYRKQHLKLKYDLNSAVKSKMEASEAFSNRYGDRFEDFFKDILAKKNSSFNKTDAEQGIGDFISFINWEIKSGYCERLVTGLKLIFPTAKGWDMHKLWDPPLGNGGFTELSAFGSLLLSRHNLFNPHVFTQLTYSFPANVNRRVPKRKQYTASTSGASENKAMGDLLAMGEDVRSQANGTFDELDTIFRGFSTETKQLRIRKGAEVYLRLGNMFEKFIFKKGFGDLYYDIRAKGRDYIGRKTVADLFNASILTDNTFEIEHRAGFTFTYQFDANVRAKLGFLYTFAGRNVPKAYEGNAYLNFEF